MAIEQKDALFVSQLSEKRHGPKILGGERRHDLNQNNQSSPDQLAPEMQNLVADKGETKARLCPIDDGVQEQLGQSQHGNTWIRATARPSGNVRT